jgi:phosphoribulokinase
MSVKHPIVAITGSSGAGTTTVMSSFKHIFRRDGIKAQVLEGDSMHRYDRMAMRAEMKKQMEAGNNNFSHFGPEANLLAELAEIFKTFGQTGMGKVRK